MVSPLTTHIKLKFVSSRIKKSLIINKIKTIEKWFKNFSKESRKSGYWVLILIMMNIEITQRRKK